MRPLDGIRDFAQGVRSRIEIEYSAKLRYLDSRPY